MSPSPRAPSSSGSASSAIPTLAACTHSPSGAFLSGDAGVFNATEGIDSVVFEVGSGTYNFTVRGAPSTRLCSQAPLVRLPDPLSPAPHRRLQGDELTLECPAGGRVTQVRFASLGDGACSPSPRYGKCHVGASKHLVEKACLGRNSCRVPVATEARIPTAFPLLT